MGDLGARSAPCQSDGRMDDFRCWPADFSPGGPPGSGPSRGVPNAQIVVRSTRDPRRDGRVGTLKFLSVSA